MDLATALSPLKERAESGMESALKLFGFARFSKDQEEIIRAAIVGQDVLGILPTGGGKSACFQVPGIIRKIKVLVISPLIALQENQVGALRKLGVKAFAFHSNMEESRRTAVHYYFKTAPKDEAAFLYISPEYLLTEMFHKRFEEVQFSLMAVDEAHCVSTWGDSFRPDYQRIRVANMRMRIPQVMALTATTDLKIEEDIRVRLPLRPNFLRVAADPMRENLELRVERLVKSSDSTVTIGRAKFAALLQLLQNPVYAGPTIVYYNSINGSANLYLRLRKMEGFLRKHGYKPYLFHAQLPYEDKMEALEGFLKDERPLVIATSAFGMGIDRKDVRQIVHYKVPKLLIEYAQQIGRAGRDGLPALCTSLHYSDNVLEAEIEQRKWEVPAYDAVERIMEHLTKRLSKLPLDKRKRYNIAAFRKGMVHLIQGNERIKFKQSAETRFLTGLALLQRVGLIAESRDGLVLHELEPGGDRHQKLIELTHMHERTLLREQERIAKFFDAPAPDQALLWEILRTE